MFPCKCFSHNKRKDKADLSVHFHWSGVLSDFTPGNCLIRPAQRYIVIKMLGWSLICCWCKETWLKLEKFLPGPRIWSVKLAGCVDEKAEVGAVPHQVGVADVVLDQTPAQDDHACVGSKIILLLIGKGFKGSNWQSVPVLTLLIASLLISLKSPRMSTTKPEQKCPWPQSPEQYRWAGTWMFEGVKEEHISKTSIRQSGGNHRDVVPAMARLEIVEKCYLESNFSENSLCSPVVYWRLIVDLLSQPVTKVWYSQPKKDSSFMY